MTSCQQLLWGRLANTYQSFCHALCCQKVQRAWCLCCLAFQQVDTTVRWKNRQIKQQLKTMYVLIFWPQPFLLCIALLCPFFILCPFFHTFESCVLQLTNLTVCISLFQVKHWKLLFLYSSIDTTYCHNYKSNIWNCG